MRHDFGYVLEPPNPIYQHGDLVNVTFVSGNPRNHLMRDESYFTVEQKQFDGSWKVLLTDADWDTK